MGIVHIKISDTETRTFEIRQVPKYRGLKNIEAVTNVDGEILVLHRSGRVYSSRFLARRDAVYARAWGGWMDTLLRGLTNLGVVSPEEAATLREASERNQAEADRESAKQRLLWAGNSLGIDPRELQRLIEE